MNRESDPLFGGVYKQKGDPTIQDVRRACAMIESVFGNYEATVLLSRYGCGLALDKLWIGSYRPFVECAARCVEWKHPPSGAGLATCRIT